MSLYFLNMLPEIFLLIGIINLVILYIMEYDKSKIYASVSRFWLVISILYVTIFYDKNSIPTYFMSNAYTLLMTMTIAIGFYIILTVSSTWFAANNKTGCRYYILMLSAQILSMILIKSQTIWQIIITCGLLWLIKENFNQETSKQKPKRISGMLVILILSYIGCIYLIYHKGNLDIKTMQDFLKDNKSSSLIYLSVISIMLPFLYALGTAPFHQVIESNLSKSTLPYRHYLAVITPLIYFSMLIKINHIIYPVYAKTLSFAYIVLALCSVFIGAIGTNMRINIPRIFAYVSCYNFGIIFLILAIGGTESEFIAFLYLTIYLIGLNGVYIACYGIKSHGEYLNSMVSLSGLATTRSRTASILLISLFSFLGLPPLAGFFAFWQMGNIMVSKEAYISIALIFFLMLFMAKAYLDIIKTVYAERKMNIFDTENKYVLLCGFINTLILMVLTFNPFHIIEKIKDMFDVIAL